MPLREPAFLQGRRSVIQRAILTSLVLVGLGMGMAWFVVLLMSGVEQAKLPRITVLGSDLLTLLTWAIVVPLSFGLTIVWPIQYYSHRSRLWMAASLPILSIGLTAPFLADPWLSRMLGGTNLAQMLTLALLTAPLVIVLTRRTRAFMAAATVSLLLSTVPNLFIQLLDTYEPWDLLQIPDHVAEVLSGVTIIGSVFTSLTVPWGIPWWWPPPRATTEPPDNQR